MSEAEMTSEIEAELRLVDEALESGAIRSNDPLERELQELALAVRAEAPEPSAEFAAELRGRVKDGFPRERGLRGPFQRFGKLRRPPAIMLAGAASLIVALAVVAGLR